MKVSAAATIGVFDGVHLGHRALIEKTVEEARRLGGEAVLFTFHPHPAAILAPGHAPKLLTSLSEKIPLLEDLGADRVEVLPFSETMSQMSPEEFIDRELLPRARLKHLVIGHDFALGNKRAGDAQRLGEIGRHRGFLLTRLSAVRLHGEVVSSTRIREAIRSGDLERARQFLGRDYRVAGTVVSGDGRGRLLGFPTANVIVDQDKVMPPFGVYAAKGWIGPETKAAEARWVVMNYGMKPTFGSREPVLEAHLLDFEGDVVGRTLVVQVVARIREERKFAGAQALAEQIRKDVAAAREILEAGASPQSDRLLESDGHDLERAGPT